MKEVREHGGHGAREVRHQMVHFEALPSCMGKRICRGVEELAVGTLQGVDPDCLTQLPVLEERVEAGERALVHGSRAQVAEGIPDFRLQLRRDRDIFLGDDVHEPFEGPRPLALVINARKGLKGERTGFSEVMVIAALKVGR